MKTLVVKLTSGNTATLFLSSTQNLVVIADSANTCMLADGVHNNGGWKIAEPASSLVTKLKNLFGA